MTGPSTAAEKQPTPIKDIVKKIKTAVKLSKPKKKPEKKEPKDNCAEKLADLNLLPPVFSNTPIVQEAAKKISITSNENLNNKKTIRRNALEIKKAEEIEENKRSKQEEEWEIPAFLRKIHRVK